MAAEKCFVVLAAIYQQDFGPNDLLLVIFLDALLLYLCRNLSRALRQLPCAREER